MHNFNATPSCGSTFNSYMKMNPENFQFNHVVDLAFWTKETSRFVLWHIRKFVLFKIIRNYLSYPFKNWLSSPRFHAICEMHRLKWWIQKWIDKLIKIQMENLTWRFLVVLQANERGTNRIGKHSASNRIKANNNMCKWNGWVSLIICDEHSCVCNKSSSGLCQVYTHIIRKYVHKIFVNLSEYKIRFGAPIRRGRHIALHWKMKLWKLNTTNVKNARMPVNIFDSFCFWYAIFGAFANCHMKTCGLIWKSLQKLRRKEGIKNHMEFLSTIILQSMDKLCGLHVSRAYTTARHWYVSYVDFILNSISMIAHLKEMCHPFR